MLLFMLEKSISYKSLLHASGGATQWIADISTKPNPFLARICVSGPRRHPWLTARSEIAPQPKRLILNLGLLLLLQGCTTSVDILAQIRQLSGLWMKFPYLIWCMGNVFYSLKIKETDFITGEHPSSLLHIAKVIMALLLPMITPVITYYYPCYHIIITYYYASIITYYYNNNGFIITYYC